MGEKLLVGLDLGTTNAKAVAFTLAGATVAESSCPYPTYFPQSGWAEQKPSDWQQCIRNALQRLSSNLGERSADIAGIGLSTHAPGLVLVDAEGQPLMENCPTWHDERSFAEACRLIDQVGPDWVGLGIPYAAFPAKLLWTIEHHPEKAASARYALGFKGYLAGWLTGHVATDPSSEPGNDEQWRSVMKACGWDLDRLPPVLPPTGVAGELKPELADEFGLPRGLPIVIGLNDGASATLSNGAIRPGQSVVSLGTNGVVYLVLPAPVPGPSRVSHALFCWPYVADRWVGGGQTKSGGSSLQWFIGVLANGKSREELFHLALEESASSPPGSRGVIFLPYLMGRGTPCHEPFAKGCFYGLTLATGRADLCRAILEGVAFGLRDITDDFARLGLEVTQVNITGGGAQSALWRQIVADVLDRQLSLFNSDSCLGAAINAALGLGLHADVQHAVEAMTQQICVTHPRSSATEIYCESYADYCQLRDHMSGSEWKT